MRLDACCPPGDLDGAVHRICEIPKCDPWLIIMNTVEEEPKIEAGSPVSTHRQIAMLETDAKADRKKAMTNEELLELAKLNLQAFENRRRMEWQLLLGYWTGLGLVTYIFASGTVSISGVLLWVMVAALIAMLAVLITCCIVPIQKAHAIDHKFFVHYVRRIEGTAAAEDRPHPRKIRMYRPWLAGQSLFSPLLTIIAVVMIIAGGKGKEQKQSAEKPVPVVSASKEDSSDAP
jgi:hypothetical protein